MKLSLLDYTQNILSALSSDEVNSIGDTTESKQVAEIVKTTFFNISSRAGLPEQTEIFQLEASTDYTQPTLMYKPEKARKIEWIKYYDTNEVLPNIPQYKYVTIVSKPEFLDYVNAWNRDETWVDTISFTVAGETFNMNIRNDTQPRYCTIISDYYILFDAYDALVDSTLQASKTMCFGTVSPEFRMEDTFIPEIDDAQVPLLLNEAKSLAFLELKQMTHAKAEQESKRQWSSVQKDKSLADKPSYFEQLPNFGRIPRYRVTAPWPRVR